MPAHRNGPVTSNVRRRKLATRTERIMTNRSYRVFVASPGDVTDERNALSKLVAELNQTISIVAPEKGLILEVVRWESHAYPAAGRPQAVINDQLRDFDIFVGIMWKRFGTPTGQARSGTEEEFNLAYENWQNHGRPHLMFYFCQTPFAPQASPSEAEQLLRVVKFRQRLSELALVWEYHDHADFADTVRPHLLRVLAKAIQAEQSAPERTASVPPGDAAFALAELRRLSVEYAEIRSRMDSGDTRTRKMEIVVTKMRSYASAAAPSLRTLADSKPNGDRLAAIAVLQVYPRADYIDWLGAQCLDRQPFLAYHAAVALLTSVRALGERNRQALQSAIDNGLKGLGAKHDTDRYRTLMAALSELQGQDGARE